MGIQTATGRAVGKVPDVAPARPRRAPGWSNASVMLLLCAVPLVLLILGLALVQYDRQREALLSDLARITDD